MESYRGWAFATISPVDCSIQTNIGCRRGIRVIDSQNNFTVGVPDACDEIYGVHGVSHRINRLSERSPSLRGR